MADFCYECAYDFRPDSDEPINEQWLYVAERNELADVPADEFWACCEGCGWHIFVRGGIRRHAFVGDVFDCTECETAP